MPTTWDAAVGLSAPPTPAMWVFLAALMTTPLVSAFTRPYKADYDLGEYRPLEPSFLERSQIMALPSPFASRFMASQFPLQNHMEEEPQQPPFLPSRHDMRLNRMLDDKLPSFELHSPDIFDLQPQLGFGMMDYRASAGPAAVPEPEEAEHAVTAVPPAVTPASGHFPRLSMRQRQFAVSPELPEFFQEHPDFLGFRLQEAEQEEEREQEHHHEKLELEEEREKEPHHKKLELEEEREQEPHHKKLELEEEREQEPHHKKLLILRPEVQLPVEGSQEDEDMTEAKRARMGVAAPLLWDHYVEENKEDDFFFTAVVAASTALAVFGIVGAGFCYHRSIRKRKDSEEVEYPAYGITGPAKDSSPAGDRKLAQSAQMYHYQHQKNQMIAVGRNAAGGQQSEGEDSEGEGEEGEGEGDYTVYECPGLASTDEMEVKNPLFADDPTPKP